MNKDVKEILIDETMIEKRVCELGKKITEDYKGKAILLIGVLKGSVPFLADLMQRIDLDVSIDFMVVSSYGSGTVSSGEVKILKDLEVDIEGKHVIVVEDIIDTGNTLSKLLALLKERNPGSIEVASFLNKPARTVVDVGAKYIGYEVPDEFVIGYGLDYQEKYRHLHYIGVLKEDIYK